MADGLSPPGLHPCYIYTTRNVYRHIQWLATLFLFGHNVSRYLSVSERHTQPADLFAKD